MISKFKVDPNETFDEETVELYRLRDSCDTEQIRNCNLPRRLYNRGFLPVVTNLSKENEPKVLSSSERSYYKIIFGGAYCMWAGNQF